MKYAISPYATSIARYQFHCDSGSLVFMSQSHRKVKLATFFEAGIEN
jgi:hypothetical protein